MRAYHFRNILSSLTAFPFYFKQQVNSSLRGWVNFFYPIPYPICTQNSTIFCEILQQFIILVKIASNRLNTLFNQHCIILANDKLVSHLLCHFLSKVLFFLFDSFACLKTDESFNGNLRRISFCYFFYIFSNSLFSVFSLYISLI